MKKNILIAALNSVLVLAIFLVDWFFLKEVPTLFSSILILDAFIFSFPIIIIQYNKYRKRKELEEMFPIFLRDFVEAVRGGLAVPQAFKSVSVNDYRSLSPYIKRVSARLDWGISVDKALLKFVEETKSKVIGRIISSVIESHRSGGNLADTFEALSSTAMEIERLRTERRVYLHSQMMTGYIIFFIFLGVIIGLEKFLVPSMTQAPTGGLMGEGPGVEMSVAYKEIFRNLVLIQGFFAGLTVGKMAEGAMVAGFKHSIFMMFIGGLVFTLIG